MSDAGDLLERVRHGGVVVPGARVVIGLSGGRDSLCLVDLVTTIAGPGRVLAVHVHHGLRGTDADRDACRAVDAARGLGAVARVVVLGPAPYSGSLAAWARDERWAALRAAADGWGGSATPVALAHTATDQAETVVLRLVSSPGTRALSGMVSVDPDRGLVRPLLAAGATRAQTGAWCAGRGLAWRDDAGNPSSPRGRVRATIGALESLDERVGPALARTAALAREDDAALRELAAALLDRDDDVPPAASRAPQAAPGDEPAPGSWSVERARLATAPVAVARRALRLLAERAAGGSCPRVSGRLEDVLALGDGARGRPAALDVGDGVRTLVDGGRIRCESSPRRSGRGPDPDSDRAPVPRRTQGRDPRVGGRGS